MSKVFKYSYYFDIQGHGSSHYIKILLDRQLSTEHYYLGSSVLAPPQSSLALAVTEAAAEVEGVIPCPESLHKSGLINVSGNELTVKTSALTVEDKRRVTQAIVKRLHRMLAPQQPRKCYSMKKLIKETERANKRWA